MKKFRKKVEIINRGISLKIHKKVERTLEVVSHVAGADSISVGGEYFLGVFSTFYDYIRIT